MSFINGKPAACVCQNFTCKAPGTELGSCQTFFRESENGEDLLAIHARKPLEKLIDCCPGFQILKKGFHRHPRVFESPGAAQVSAERSTAGHALQSIMQRR